MKKNYFSAIVIFFVFISISFLSLAALTGDFNSDGKVDFEDLMILALAYSSTPTDANWNPSCDLHLDSKIDFEDLMIFVLHYGETLAVHNLTQDTYYQTIQEAIDDANSEDIIIVYPGTYSEKIVFDNQDITVRGTDIYNSDIVNNTIIRGNQNGSVVQFINSDTSTLQGFTITNGKSFNGGGIDVYNNSSPTISFNKISGNMADTTGGGIYVYSNSSPTISDNEITGNTANEGGGIYVDSNCSPTITSNDITNNEATDEGGGIYVWAGSTPTIGGSDLTDTDNFNTICGNSPDQVTPDSYPNNYIYDICPSP